MVRSVYQNGTASAPPKPLVQNPGSTSAIDPANGATVNFYKVKDTLHAVTTGVNYRF